MSDIEREEFEQAVTDRWSDSYSFTRFGDEDYFDEVLEGMWQGWQASRQALEGEAVDVERIADTVRDHLGDIFACTRVWEAWQVGTMTQNDFTPADETELADEIAGAVATLYTHPASADDSKHHAVMQAQMWAQEARTQKAIVKEIGEMVGCANDWEMVEAVRNALATLPPNEHGKNRYGLDMAYFRNLFNRELNRPLTDFRPDELARVLARASHTADSEVLKEREFHAASPQAVNVPEWQLEARRAFWAGIEIAECFNVVAIAPRWDEYIAKRKEDLSQYVTRAGDGDGSTPTNADVWIKCSDRLPNLGQRVILKSRGVVQNYMPVFDQGDDDLGMGDHFWDFEDVNKIDNPLVDFEKDCWMPKPKKEQSHD